MEKEKINSDSKPKEKREFLDIIGDIATFLITLIVFGALLMIFGIIPSPV
jgi:hypothetical protein